MAISPDMMRLALDELKKRDRSYMRPSPYQKHLPKRLEHRSPANQGEAMSVLEPIAERGRDQLSLIRLQERNEREKRALKRAKNMVRQEKKFLRGVVRAEPERSRRPRGTIDLRRLNIETRRGNKIGGGPTRLKGKRWGRDGIPEVSDIGRLTAPVGNNDLARISIQGHSTLVDRQVAPIFQALLRDLNQTGYKVHSLGGFNVRKIGGSNTWSNHARGLAIDINPAQNPFQNADGNIKENLPRGIGKLAARYGLIWGGGPQWNSVKDPMHFSVRFKGVL